MIEKMARRDRKLEKRFNVDTFIVMLEKIMHKVILKTFIDVNTLMF